MTVPEPPELRLDGPCHECGGVGPVVVIVQCDTDPGDMGEPRIVHADDETIVFVPSFDLWPDAARVAAPSDGLRAAALEKARLVAQWHGSIGSGPIEELNAELGDLGEAVRAALATTGQPECDCAPDWLMQDGSHHPDCPMFAQPEDTRTADPGGLRVDRYGEPPAYCPWCGHLRHERFDHGCFANVGGPSPEPCGCDEPFALTPEATAPEPISSLTGFADDPDVVAIQQKAIADRETWQQHADFDCDCTSWAEHMDRFMVAPSDQP